MEYKNCPSCNVSWVGEDIFKSFLNIKNDPNHPLYNSYKNHTETEILGVASMYGYTLENPKHFENQIGLEYPELYDGILIYKCHSCNNTVGRFSGIKNISPQKEKDYYNNKPIHKFNNGIGATLCYNCSVIIKTGLHNDILCNDCKQKN